MADLSALRTLVCTRMSRGPEQKTLRREFSSASQRQRRRSRAAAKAEGGQVLGRRVGRDIRHGELLWDGEAEKVWLLSDPRETIGIESLVGPRGAIE